MRLNLRPRGARLVVMVATLQGWRERIGSNLGRNATMFPMRSFWNDPIGLEGRNVRMARRA